MEPTDDAVEAGTPDEFGATAGAVALEAHEAVTSTSTTRHRAMCGHDCDFTSSPPGHGTAASLPEVVMLAVRVELTSFQQPGGAGDDGALGRVRQGQRIGTAVNGGEDVAGDVEVPRYSGVALPFEVAVASRRTVRIGGSRPDP